MIILSGPGSERIGLEIASLLGVECSAAEHRFFPDGESYLRITGEVEERDVVLIHSTGPPQDQHLVQLLLLIDAVSDGGARVLRRLCPIWPMRGRTGTACRVRP